MNITRYTESSDYEGGTLMIPHPDGEWVRFEDVASTPPQQTQQSVAEVSANLAINGHNNRITESLPVGTKLYAVPAAQQVPPDRKDGAT